MLLDHIEHCGDELTGQKRVYYEKTKERDLAIVTLLLGTGIRVSECVGLDVEDVDFKNNGIKVTRKGGNEMVVYFGHEVEKALKKYLEVRKNIVPVAGHEHALFYSTQRKRIGIQAVENLVKNTQVPLRPQKNHTTQASQYLRYYFVSGNRRYLPCSRCIRSQRCKHHKETLCSYG